MDAPPLELALPDHGNTVTVLPFLPATDVAATSSLQSVATGQEHEGKKKRARWQLLFFCSSFDIVMCY
jgi:hypothetical protein